MTDPAAFLAEVARGRAERVVPVAAGFVVLSPRRFGHAYDHNALWVVRPADPAGVVADADAALAAFGHRRVEVDHAGATPALAAALSAAGYTAEEQVVMSWVRAADADRPEGGVTTVTLPERIAFAERLWSAEFGETRADVARELAERARSAVDAAQCTFLAVVDDDGTLQASCDLFVRGGVAQIEEVVTVTAARGRGHASRLVRAAVETARAADPGATVFLVADAGDWPRLLYRRLGFEVTGARTVWTRLSGP